jgi:hypothetical protein
MVLLMVLHAADLDVLGSQLDRSLRSGCASASVDSVLDGPASPADHLRLCEQAFPAVCASADDESTTVSEAGYHPMQCFSRIIARVATLQPLVSLGSATSAPVMTGDHAPALLDALTVYFPPAQLRAMVRSRHELRAGDHPCLSAIEQSKADALLLLLQ